MIVLEPGFKVVNKQWPQYINKHKDEIEEILKKELPNVMCRIFEEMEFKHCSEEFYFQKIALVVDENGIVVCAPKYFGAEPDFDQLANPIGKDCKSVCSDLLCDIPNVKVVVENENGDRKWSNNEAIDHYVLLVADGKDNVVRPPSYVRVAKEE